MKAYVVLSLVLCQVSTVCAQLTYTLSPAPKTMRLQEILALLDGNPALMSMDDKINSYKAYAKGSRSIEPPKISAGLWMFPYTTPPVQMDGTPAENKGSWMVGVEQMIMHPSKRKAEQLYMEGMASTDQAMRDYDKQNMMEEAKKMYYEWIILKKKFTLYQNNDKVLQLMIKSGEIGYTYNQNLLSRVYKAKAELYNNQKMMWMVENEIARMNVGLNTMINSKKSYVFDVDTNYVIENYDLLPTDTVVIRNNRSDVRSVNETIKLYALKRKLELSKKKPDFGIQYAHMNNFGSMPSQFNLMGMITIPIAPWASKSYKANLQGLKYETSAMYRRKEAFVNDAEGNMEKIKQEMANKKRLMQLYEQSMIPALEKNYQTSLIAYEHMKEDLFMTIDAWMALSMARVEYLNVVGDVLKLQASYERQIEKAY